MNGLIEGKFGQRMEDDGRHGVRAERTVQY